MSSRFLADKIESEREKAIAYHDTIVPAMEEIRYHIDKLEDVYKRQACNSVVLYKRSFSQ